MDSQRPLFGFKEMMPKANLKKIITKERIQEVQQLLEKKDALGAEQALRDIRYKLEAYERRLSNGKESDHD
jgi:hypothetical protein